MIKNNRFSRRITIAIILAFIVVQAVVFSNDVQDFNNAIEVVKHEEPKDVATDLVSLAPWDNDARVTWEHGSDGQKTGKALMATWIPNVQSSQWLFLKPKFFTSNGSAQETIGITREAWVSAVPQVRNFLRNSQLVRECCLSDGSWDHHAFSKNQDNIKKIVIKYLGLSMPPHGKEPNEYFAEYWVQPKDMFRPCPDAAVVDSYCVFDPYSINETIEERDPVSGDVKKVDKIFMFIPASAEHKAWYWRNKRSGGYPLTRLGYTYNWNKGFSHKGASEFIIKTGTTVAIKAIYTFEEYCMTDKQLEAYYQSLKSQSDRALDMQKRRVVPDYLFDGN